MEELIRQAFLHIEVIGPHVAEGHYDLVGPNGDIILPQVWETVIEPDWTITMHMWPIPEKPKDAEPAPADAPAPDKGGKGSGADAAGPEQKKKSEPGGTFLAMNECCIAKSTMALSLPLEMSLTLSSGNKKPRAKAGDAGGFAMWMLGGGNRQRQPKQPPKGEKKPDAPPQ